MNVALRPGASVSLRDFEEKLRSILPKEFPGSHFSLSPGDLISQTLNFGTPSVIGIDHRSTVQRRAELRGTNQTGTCENKRAARSRIRRASSLPVGGCPHKPHIGRTAWRDSGSGWTSSCIGNLLKPLRVSQLLA